MRTFIRFCLLLALCIFDSSMCPGQHPLYIEGRVLDPDGRPVPNAEVSIRYRNETPIVADTKTDNDGRYQFNIVTQSLENGILARSSDSMWMSYMSVQFSEEDLLKTKGSLKLSDLPLKKSREIQVLVADSENRPVADATVAVQGHYRRLAAAQTNTQGEATVRFPDTDLQAIGVIKGKFGIDYRIFEDGGQNVQTHPSKLSQNFAGKLKFTLNGVREVSVQALDPDQKPVPGLCIIPWMINKPDRGESWNLSECSETQRVTDDLGVAHFDMLPVDQEQGVVFYVRPPREDWYLVGDGQSRDGSLFVDWQGQQNATLQFKKKMAIKGKVFLPDGAPASGIHVEAYGAFVALSVSKDEAITDAKGDWSMFVQPDGYYLLRVKDKTNQYAALSYDGISLMGNEPLPEFDFLLEPAKRIYGKLSGDFSSRSYVSIRQLAKDYEKLPPESQLPNPDKSNQAVLAAMSNETTFVDKDGSFQFFVGPGEFILSTPTCRQRNIRLTESDSEIECDFTLPKQERSSVKISTVLAESKSPLGNIQVLGFTMDSSRNNRIQGVSNEEGTVVVERENMEHYLLAKSNDGKLAGWKKLEIEEDAIEIELSPTFSITGELIGSEGDPIENADLTIFIEIVRKDGVLSTLAVKATTGKIGKFQFSGLVPGASYGLHRVTTKDGKGRATGFERLMTITAFEDSDLGEIEAR